MQLENVRTWQINTLENNIKSIERVVRLADPAALNTYRDGGTGWTVLQVLCHLRDFELVFLERGSLTVQQHEPPLPFPNPDKLAAERRYHDEAVEDVLTQWKANRAQMLEFLRGRSESDWERVGVHPLRGRLTLFEQLLLGPTHDAIHLEQITRILSEKREG